MRDCHECTGMGLADGAKPIERQNDSMIVDPLQCTDANDESLQEVRPSDSSRLDLSTALAEERLRISRDLHDRTAQQISLIKFNLESLRTDVSSSDGVYKLSQTIRDVEELAKELHWVAHGLRPSALERFGFIPSLDALLSDWSARFHIKIHFSVEGISGPFHSAVEQALFYVTQESLTNIAKHALTATDVSVTLRCTNDEITLSIVDNGGSPSPRASKSLSHGYPSLGLIGLRERLEPLNGTLEFTSDKLGTSVTARISSRR